MSSGARVRFVVAAMGVLGLVAAGCSSGKSKAAATSTSSSSTTAVGTLVVTRETALGTILAGGNGMTLYVFDQDTGGKIACTAACTNTWKPLTATDGSSLPTISGVVGFTLVTRPDGSHQVAAASRPLYFYAGDSEPGDTKGDGLGGAWHAARLSILGFVATTTTTSVPGSSTSSSRTSTTSRSTTTRSTTSTTKPASTSTSKTTATTY